MIEKSKQESASPVTQILVKKIHGGRKQDSKFWQSEFSNEAREEPRQPSAKNKKNYSVTLQIIALLVGLLAGIGILGFKYGYENLPRFFRDVASDVKSLFTADAKKNEVSPKTESKTEPRLQSRQIASPKYTDEQIRRAVEEVLWEKEQKKLAADRRRSLAELKKEEQKFEYKIELDSGAVVYTEDLKIVGDEVTYTWENGLVVSINMDHIKSLKRIPKPNR